MQTPPTVVSCAYAPAVAPAPAVSILPLPLPTAPAPVPVPAPAVCQVLSANISLCGGTALSTPSLSFASCVANVTGVSSAAVVVSSVQNADSLPCQADGTPAVGCYGQALNSTDTDISGRRLDCLSA